MMKAWLRWSGLAVAAVAVVAAGGLLFWWKLDTDHFLVSQVEARVAAMVEGPSAPAFGNVRVAPARAGENPAVCGEVSIEDVPGAYKRAKRFVLDPADDQIYIDVHGPRDFDRADRAQEACDLFSSRAPTEPASLKIICGDAERKRKAVLAGRLFDDNFKRLCERS